jgi:hypothetical protein
MRKKCYFLFVLLAVVSVISCKTIDDIDPEPKVSTYGNSKALHTFDGSMVNDWNTLQIRLIQSTIGYSTPVAARSLAYVNLALYESTFYGMDGYESLEGKIQGLENLPKPEMGKEYNWALAGNVAQYTLLREIYGTTSDFLKARIDTLRRQYEVKLKAGVDSEQVERSIRFGADIAKSIWTFSKNDGGHEAYMDNFKNIHVRNGGVASWNPTSSQTKPLLAKWGSVRTFLSSNVDIKPKVKLSFSFERSSNYFLGVNEVYSTVQNLNENQKDILNLWQDGEMSYTSAGHHLAVLNNIAKKEALKLDEMVLLNLKMAIALHDASIACMKTKYEIDYMRPVTYIRQTIDPKWSNIEKDDSSPEFTSLPATIAGVSAEIMANKFGEEYAFEDDTYASTVGKRPYKNFSTFATEASLAQLFAGNHMRVSIESGLENGRSIAKNVIQLNLKNTTNSTL